MKAYEPQVLEEEVGDAVVLGRAFVELGPCVELRVGLLQK
jgi:hypothetical protein